MNKRYTIYLLIIFAAITPMTVMTACQNADDAETSKAKTVIGWPIEIGGLDVTPSDITRDASDAYNVSLPGGKEVAVYMYDEGTKDMSGKVAITDADKYVTWVYQTAGSPYLTDEGKYRSSLTLVSHEKSPDFPSNNSVFSSKVTLFGMFPYDKILTPSTTGYSFTVPINQTDTNTDSITGADLLTTNGLVDFTKEQCIDNGDKVDLVLHHQMAKLRVVFTPKAGSDLTAQNMPTKFHVLGVQRKISIDPKAGSVTTIAIDDEDSEEVKKEKRKTITHTGYPLKGQTSQAFFLPPQTLSTTTPLLKFNILGSDIFRGIEGATFTPATEVTLQAGHEYLITVTVDVDFITMQGTIDEWDKEKMKDITEIL